ncbi:MULTISPECIES: tail protein X [unclassified Sphingomonas]|uniref:tail protein X n=1 Tax=unclassified Sphingomonas TaxID=196159 RepID=UPI002269A43E|nr:MULTISPECIES: tail protein X [unclassified Sphingomonas]
MADMLHAAQGDTLDALIWRERALGPAAIGAVLAANPGLAGLGPILPIGTAVTIPAVPVPTIATRTLVQLWD